MDRAITNENICKISRHFAPLIEMTEKDAVNVR